MIDMLFTFIETANVDLKAKYYVVQSFEQTLILYVFHESKDQMLQTIK